MRSKRLLSGIAVTLAVGLSGSLPASASAEVIVFIAPVGPGIEWGPTTGMALEIQDRSGGNDIVSVNSALGDLRISSSTGIGDPIPSPCIRSVGLVRCPLASELYGSGGLTMVEAHLGGGNDIWGVGIVQQIDAAAIELFTAYMGAGHDQANGGLISNELHGGKGPDDLSGGARRDYLFGNGKNDFLIGLGGSDYFRCGAGKHDRFSDGPGKDRVETSTCEKRVGGGK